MSLVWSSHRASPGGSPFPLPTYHANSFVGSTAMSPRQGSFMGRITAPQLKLSTCCGGNVTTGMLNGHVEPWGEPSPVDLVRTSRV